ncbi:MULTISPECIES: MATE family efflux transporter [Nonomuraea]|uniref:Probable multidrug resistance protein NorM n=1 Tax=Nonomuraea mangrovi TaxID=2316207 RepID=A0ABW4T3K9_9ACTN
MIRLALPIYVELLTAVVAVSVIDLLWVSGLGDAAIAAVTVATTTEYFAYGLILAPVTGVTVLVGRRDGKAPIAPLIRSGWRLWLVGSAAIAIPGLLLREPLAELLTADAASATLTADFFLISMAGLPIYFAQSLADGVVKGLGNTKVPMRNALICNALVIVLDPVFIYGLGMGVRGAALATVLARAATLAVSLRTLSRLTPRDGDGREGVGEIVRTGLPMSGDFLARALVGLLLIEIVARYGVAAQAGYGIGMKIMLAGVMVFYALRQAAMIRTARSEDTGSPLRTGLAAGALVALALNVVAEPAAALFTDDPAAAVSFLRWMTLYLVPFGGLIAAGGVAQASGRGSRLLAATLAGFAVQLPLAYLLSSWLGVTGVWLAMAAGTTLSLAVAPVRSAGARANAPCPAPRSTRTAADPPSGR